MNKKAPSGRSGYTLPVFACAAAIAAYRKLNQQQSVSEVQVNLINPDQTITIPIEQVAMLDRDCALGITRSDPGDNLDLTRDMAIWVSVRWATPDQSQLIKIEGGEGVGRKSDPTRSNPESIELNPAAIYQYAQDLIQANLRAEIKQGNFADSQVDRGIHLTIILPEGQSLAKRTSNEAFGVVNGLALLGTSGIAQALSAPEQLQSFQSELRQKALAHKPLVFCLGENGLDIARSLGIPEPQLLKMANWIGPMLVLAGQEEVPAILLLGYHGKLIKLAGGIFHTHHHLADGRQEILAAIAASHGIPTSSVQVLLKSPTLEAGLEHLMQLESQDQTVWSELIYRDITGRIEKRAQDYIKTHIQREPEVGCLLFNRGRQIFAKGQAGQKILDQILASLG